jgi:predicted O-methyltransferase YrrM
MIAPRLTFDSVQDVARQSLMWGQELPLLHRLAKSAVGPGVLVEVGSWVGASAVVILASQHEAGQADVRLFCIDNFEQNTRAGFEQNVGPYIATGEVTLLAGDSHDIAARWPAERRIKFLFLDGDHRYGHVKREIELFEPHLLPGAVVAFHDAHYREEPPASAFSVPFMYRGVSLALRERIMPDRRYSHFQCAHSLVACRFDPAGAVDDDADRAAFVAAYERATAINSWPLRGAYAAYVVAEGAKRAVSSLQLEAPVRKLLRTLGFKRMFGRDL